MKKQDHGGLENKRDSGDSGDSGYETKTYYIFGKNGEYGYFVKINEFLYRSIFDENLVIFNIPGVGFAQYIKIGKVTENKGETTISPCAQNGLFLKTIY
jgi:hypothetical protein